MNNKLQAKDLINVGIFTALYFTVGCAIAMLGFIPIFVPLLAILWPLIAGIVFMMFTTKVKKFGMVTIMAILSGLLMGLTGMGFWGVPLGVLFGVLGDFIMKSGEYKSINKNIIGHGVFSLWLMGTYIPFFFFRDDSYATFVSGFGEEYAKQTMGFMPEWSLFIIVTACFIFGIVGGILGKIIMKKHFLKAGIL